MVTYPAQEELGLSLTVENIKLLGFGVDYKYYQWNMLGIVECNKTAEQIIENRTRGTLGKWELENIHFYNFEIKEVFNLLKKEKIWDTGKVALYWALVNRYGKKEVDRIVNKIFK